MKKLFFTTVLVAMCALTKAQTQPPSVKDSIVIKEYFFAGIIEKMNDNYAKANAIFSKILLIDPHNDATHFELANIFLQRNKLLDAELAIKKALVVKPRQVWYLKLQTEIYKRTGNMQALIPAFDTLIELDPEQESYHFDRANALFILGEVEQSKRAFDALEQKFGISKASTAAKERFKNDQPSQYSSLQRRIAENPTDVKNYLHLSGLLLAQRKNEEALEFLLKARLAEPENYEVNLALADVYYALKQNDKAFVALKLAFSTVEMPLATKLKILNLLLSKFANPVSVKNATELCIIALVNDKDDAKLLVIYGDLLYKNDNFSNAKLQYLAASKSEPQLYVAWEKLLGVQTLMGGYEEAIRSSEEALSMYPNQAILHYYNAFALHRNGQNAEAGLALKDATQLSADDHNLTAMILALQAEVMIDQGKFREADESFARAIALTPKNYLLISNYAYFLALRNHDLNKAEQFAHAAAVALPENSSVLDTYAVVLFKLNKLNEALTYVQKALQNNEAENAVYLEHYGDILFVKGDKDNAIIQWQKAKSAGNQSKNLRRKINEKKYIK